MRKSLISALLSVCFLALPAAFAQSGIIADVPTSAAAKRPMTFDDMMQMKRLGETAVSPDGKWLVYSVTTVDLAKNSRTAELWIQKIEGGDPVKLAMTKPGDGGVQFSADGKRILFVSDRTGANQIWLMDFDTATGAVSNLKKLTNLDLGIDNAQWAPDGKSIVFTMPVYPDCPAIVPDDEGKGAECSYARDEAAADSKVKAQIFTHLLYRHWNHFVGDKRSHLFLVSVESGGVRDLNPNDKFDVPPYSVGGGGGFAISPDSKELAFTENLDAEQATSTNGDIFTLDLTNTKAKPVKVSASPGGDWTPAYSPDGKYIAWRSQARNGYESDKFRLMLYDRTKKTTRELMAGFDRWVDEFVWQAHSSSIFVTSSYQGETQLLLVDIPMGSYSALGGTEGELGDLKQTADGSYLIASAMHVTAPSEVVLFDMRRAHMVTDRSRTLGNLGHTINPDRQYTSAIVFDEYALTHLNDALLAQLDLSKMEPFWFTAKDGVKVEGFLIRPPGFNATKKYPLKFLIHGGPEGDFGDSWSYRWNEELFAANGYVVVMINFRGSTGYGQAFTEGIVGDWGGKPFTDLMTGLDYAEAHYPFIDKTRECALGASYGGYMADWILGHTDRFKCIVTHDGMYDAESAFGSTEELWFNQWEFKGRPWDYVGKPDSENPFRKWSPMLSAKNFKTPTLVVHNQLDYRLDVSQGYELFTALQLQGVPSKMLYFPDEGHWVLKPQNSQLWWKTVNDWVDEWTKPASSR
jgi:dipeptidyl aminopeptidase/acylaminoacyl peptidase